MEKWVQRLRRKYPCFPVYFVTELVSRYQQHDISHRSAAMAYYLLFSIFPLLIFLSSLLGLFNISTKAAMETLSTILPDSVVEICVTYLTYISGETSTVLLWFSLVFSIYFPARAALCLMEGVRLAYGLPQSNNTVLSYVRVGIFTVALILTMSISLVVITFGERLLLYLAGDTQLARFIIALWSSLRFLLLGFLLFATLCVLYALSQDHRPGLGEVFPGALLSLGAFLVISVGFSYYVENFGNYSIIYGTLGAVIVLMIWLSVSAATLVLGAECNGAVLCWKKKEKRN